MRTAEPPWAGLSTYDYSCPEERLSMDGAQSPCKAVACAGESQSVAGACSIIGTLGSLSFDKKLCIIESSQWQVVRFFANVGETHELQLCFSLAFKDTVLLVPIIFFTLP